MKETPGMDMAAIRESVKKFVDGLLAKDPKGRTLLDTDSFFEAELIDSTGVLELVLFIEQEFDFRVEDEEIVPENLDSVERLVAYIQSKLRKPRVEV
jgi:acyl carrier protein